MLVATGSSKWPREASLAGCMLAKLLKELQTVGLSSEHVTKLWERENKERLQISFTLPSTRKIRDFGSCRMRENVRTKTE